MKNTSILKAGAAPLAMGFAMLASPAFAQASADEACDPSTDVSCDVDEAAEGDLIVVTGTLFKTDRQTASPVTTVDSEEMERRGITTVEEAIQTLSSNNGPALTNSFSANGAFAGGAAAVSLRGLSTNSTLVLFDGLRASYYPLADDGTRNFVDINTIPDDIVERIEVVRDGASSLYGADAIAGVVNIITKRQINGITARGSAAINEDGKAPRYSLSLTGGTGDLATDGFNAYVSGFYYNSGAVYNRDLPYPFNSSDESGVCSPDGSVCGPDNRRNGSGGSISTSASYAVAPAGPDNSGRTGRYQYLNFQGCDSLRQLTAAQIADSSSVPADGVLCVDDQVKDYGVVTPDIERWGVSGRVTGVVSDTIEAYGEVNFLSTKVSYTGYPQAVYALANTGINFPQFATFTNSDLYADGSAVLALPVYVCAEGVGDANGTDTGCDASNGTLNPNNPFAASGQVARIIGRDLNNVTYSETRNRSYRGALGITGDIAENLSFDFSAVAMHTDLTRIGQGYIRIQNLLDAIARGTYNFVNPSANSQDVLDQVMPENRSVATSDQVEFRGYVSTGLAELPGGTLNVALGGSIRYEAVDAPSFNDDVNGPTQRYFTFNAFGTEGSRWVKSVFGEIKAPIIDMLELSASARYDSYSSGQDAFSPKVGFTFQPIQQVLLRGAYSEGFRIPSFGEANALPTTGYVTTNPTVFNDAFLAQYSTATDTCSLATFSDCPTYIRNDSYGQTTLASPNLEPEKSRSFTAGIFVEPIRNFSLSVDYYNIKKTNVITSPSNAPALIAYYSGQPIPDGYTVIPGAPDPNFPNATPTAAFVESQLINANTQRTSGLDFAVDGAIEFSPGFSLRSHLEATYIIKLETEFPDGSVERYDGTLGNFNLTAGSGTPSWRGYWLNSFQFGDNFETNVTVNYIDGYNLSAEDQGSERGDGSLNPGYSPTGDDIPDYTTVDLQLRFKVSDQYSLTAGIQNLFDKYPPVDVVTYGAYLYNPVQGGNGILGRQFRVSATANF